MSKETETLAREMEKCVADDNSGIACLNYPRAVALLDDFARKVRKRCADNWESEWWGFPDLTLAQLHNGASSEQWEDITRYRAAILSDEEPTP